MKWTKGAMRGELVAGGYGEGDRPHQLAYPTDVLREKDGSLLIAELGNQRVTRWGPAPEMEIRL